MKLTLIFILLLSLIGCGKSNIDGGGIISGPKVLRILNIKSLTLPESQVFGYNFDPIGFEMTYETTTSDKLINDERSCIEKGKEIVRISLLGQDSIYCHQGSLGVYAALEELTINPHIDLVQFYPELGLSISHLKFDPSNFTDPSHLRFYYFDSIQGHRMVEAEASGDTYPVQTYLSTTDSVWFGQLLETPLFKDMSLRANLVDPIHL